MLLGVQTLCPCYVVLPTFYAMPCLSTGGAAVPAPEEVPEESLELSMDNLEKYWANDDRWSAAKPEQRAALFQARFGAAAAAAAQRKVEQRRQMEADYHALLVQLGVTADSSWSREVREAIRKAIRQHQDNGQRRHQTAESHGQLADEDEDGALIEQQEEQQDDEPAANATDSKTAAYVAGAAAAAALEETERESLFRRYASELAKQREREHATVREQQKRQAAAEARMAEQQAEAESRQRRAARSDATAAFNTLLSELIRDHTAVFEEWLPKLQKDPLVS